MANVEIGSNAFLEVGQTGLWSVALAIVAVIVLERLAARFADDAYNSCKQLLRRLWLRLKSYRPLVKPAAKEADSSIDLVPKKSTASDLLQTTKGCYSDLSSFAEGELATFVTAHYQPHQGDAQQVVLKRVRDAADNDLMQNEVATLRSFHIEAKQYGKHLPRVLDQFRAEDGCFVTALALCQGLDLVALRARFPEGVAPRHVVWIFRRLLSILGYAHSRGVLHGNIEPAHIMVRPADHNVWLLDWCYAIHRPRETGQGFRIVHQHYSAPEVAERKPPLPAADLYSLGLCMLYLLGGDVRQHTFPAKVPRSLQRFILFFLRESAIQRPQDAWEMYRKLEQIRDELYGAHRFVAFVLPPQ